MKVIIKKKQFYAQRINSGSVFDNIRQCKYTVSLLLER